MSVEELRRKLRNRGRTLRVLDEVCIERERQDAKFGDQAHRKDGTSSIFIFNRDSYRRICDRAESEGGASWVSILREETYEAFAEIDREALRKELIQVAAVAVAWVENIDKREGR